jgi:hypothetical protein
MKRLSLFGLIGALALPLVASARPAAAAEVKVVARASGDNDPFVWSWVDGADGKLTIDDKIAAQFHDVFAGVQYLFTSQNTILLGRLQGQELKPIVPTVYEVHNEAQTYYLTHVRSQDKTLFLDGTIIRFKDEPTKGYAQWNLLLITKSGSTISSMIEQELTFAANATNPEPDPGPGPLPLQ